MFDFKKVSSYLNILVMLCSLIGGYIAVDAHYAKQEEFRKLEVRFEMKLLNDRLTNVQERIWKLDNSTDALAIAEKKMLQKEYEDLRHEIEMLMGKVK